MATTVLTRRRVIFYNVTKLKKINKDDTLVEKFDTIAGARRRASQLSKNGNLKSLKNNNGISIPFGEKSLEYREATQEYYDSPNIEQSCLEY